MNTRRLILLAGSLGFTALTLHAGPRTSANYSISAESTDAGGKRATSANYTNDGSAGGITGISTVASPAESNKAGYIGQLYEISSLTLAAATPTVNETATDQLSAVLTLDDATFLPVSAASVTWSVLNGPLTGISAGGLATAGVVYQNTPATAQGLFSGLTGTVGVTVVNTLPDNFQTYASDGMADDWQVQYFGVNNPLAGPLLDPDGDGYNNLFEFRASIIPTDRLSTFSLNVNTVAGGNHSVSFSPRFAGSTYILQGSSDLSLWAPVNGTVTDNGEIRTILDPAGTGPRRYYRVDVQKP